MFQRSMSINSGDESAIINGNGNSVTQYINHYEQNQIPRLNFNEQQLKDLLIELDEVFFDDAQYEENFNPEKVKRDMNIKNKRHGISNFDYERMIEKEMDVYARKMDEFFNNPRNIKFNRIYKNILRIFNQHLIVYSRSYVSIFCFFDSVSSAMYERHRDELEKLNNDFLIILGYYMYYICDLDKGG